MNKHFYRTIFSHASGNFIAVADSTPGRGKSSVGNNAPAGSTFSLLRFSIISVLIAAAFGQVTMLHAQTIAYKNGGPAPIIDRAANGVPVVQIVQPNAVGLSHNRYTDFNVDSHGVILNNSPTSVNTTLSGFIQGNAQINTGAKVILNETVGVSRSNLNGYIEVAGQRADVIIANPNGLSVNGFGVINGGHVTLTTGVPQFGGAGSLAAYRVTRGNIAVDGAGINALPNDSLSLISRSLIANAQIHASNLGIVTGANVVTPDMTGIEVIQGTGDQPTIAIDTSLLGGLYANKIKLVGTEAGVGIRTYGDMASSGDFSLDANGKVTLHGKTNAGGQFALHSSDDVSNTGTIYARHAQIDSAGIVTNSGTLAAQGDLDLNASGINSTGVLAAGIDANGQATQVGSIVLSADDSLIATGQNTAGSNVSMTGARIDLTGAHTSANADVTLTSTAGNIQHTGGTLQASGSATIHASGVVINDSGVINTAQLISHSAALSNVGGSITQSGASDTSITIDGALVNTSGTIATNAHHFTVQAGSVHNNAGQLIHAGNGAFAINTGDFNNVAGRLATNGELRLNAVNVDNHSGNIAANHSVTLNLSGDLHNAQGSIQAGNALAVSATNLDNSAGRITSLDTSGLALDVRGLLTNSAGTSAEGAQGGVIGSNGDLTLVAANAINSGSITAGKSLLANVGHQLNNDGGRIAAAHVLTVQTAALNNAHGTLNAARINATVAQLNNNSGKIHAGQLILHATNLSNQQGHIAQFGNDASVIDVADTLDNSDGGLIQTNSTDLTLTPQRLNNRGGTISLAGTGQLQIAVGAGALQNQGGTIGSNGATSVIAANINNQRGRLFGQGATTVTATVGDIDNRKGYLSGDRLALHAAGVVNNTNAKMEALHKGLAINANSLHNAGGTIQNLGPLALTIYLQQGLTNTAGGLIGSAGDAHIHAANINNTAGTFYSKQNLTLNTNGTLTNNDGIIQSDGSIDATASNAVNNHHGLIEASGAGATLTIAGASIDNSGGRIANSGTGDTTIDSGSSIVNDAGTIGGNGDVTIIGTTFSNTQQGQVIAARDLNAAITHTLDNRHGSMFAARHLSVEQTSLTLNNAEGKVSAAGDILLTLASLDNTSGQISNTAGASGNIVLETSANVTNTAGNIGSDKDVSVNANTLIGEGKIIAGQDATINLQGDYTNTAGNTYSANNVLRFTTSGLFTNAGTLSSQNALRLTASDITNNYGALINSAHSVVTAKNNLINQGRIYGDDMALGANTLLNAKDAVIAARNDLQIGAHTITNQEHALMTSLGNIAIGGGLDGNDQAAGRADVVTNTQATIDAGGNFTLNANTFNNLNPTFATAPVHIATLQVKRFSTDGVHWITAAEGAYLSNNGHYTILHTPDGATFRNFWQQKYTQTSMQDQVIATDPGQLYANGNMLLNVGTVNNQASAIVAGLGLGGTGDYLYNTIPQGKTTITQVGTPNGGAQTERFGTVYHQTKSCGFGGRKTCDQWSKFTAINTVLPGANVALSIWQGDAQPARLSNPAIGHGAGGNLVSGGNAAQLSGNQSGQQLTGTGQTVDTAEGSAGSNTGTAGNPHTVARPGQAIPNLRLPTNQLFVIQTLPGRPLIETDPAFTNYKTFISSDYMLGRLGLNPMAIQKRLGDGYYEQKLINDQITQLTGKRLLGNTTNEQQYEALMNNGITFAQQFALTPGTALTAAQIASLTADIVWLVNQTVTLPDGSNQQVFAPVVYLAKGNAAEARPTGALISADTMDLSYGNLHNAGTLQGNTRLIVNATNIDNRGTMLASGKDGQVVLTAQNDLTSSGTIRGKRVGMLAGNNLTMISEVEQITGITGDHTGITQVATIRADQLSMQAGHDINLQGAYIAATGDAALVAGNNLNIGTVTTSDSARVDVGSNGHNNTQQSTSVGSTLTIGGNLTMAADRDITATAATIHADQALTLAAGRDVNVLSGSQQSSHDIHTHMASSGFLSSESIDINDAGHSDQSIGSSLTGNRIAIVSGRDATIQGSHVSAIGDVTINSGRDLTIVSAHNTSSGSYVTKEQQAGFSADLMTGINHSNTAQDQTQNFTGIQHSGSDINGANVNLISGRDATITASVIAADQDVGIYAGRNINVLAAANTDTLHTDSHQSGTSIGILGGVNGRFTNFSKTNAAQNTDGTATSHSTSLISANAGNLNLQAGLDAQYNGTGQGNITTQGAELLAKNQLTIAANAVDLQAIQNASNSQSHAETHSVTLGSSLTGAIGGAITGIGDKITESQHTSNDRLKGALQLKAGYDAYQLVSGGQLSQTTTESLDANAQTEGGGFGVSVNLGSSQSQQDSSNRATQSRGTTVQADAITVTAREGDITMQGAKLQARNITLDAAKNINLLAAKNTADLTSSNSGSNVGIGATLGANGQQTGLSFQLGASLSKGHANGSETTFDNTQITATNHLTINSGGDTNLIGAQLAADKIKATIGGNLTIMTLQDQNNYDSKQENGGFSLSLCIPPICIGSMLTGSVNYARQTVDHNYRSAVGQSGIAAGNGGFDLTVKGNTDLQGGALTSTAEKEKNTLRTASLTSTDLTNSEHTRSNSFSAGFSTNGVASNIAANVIGNLNSGAGMPKDSDQHSHTNSVISPAKIILTGSGDATQDAQSQATADTLTTRDATTANDTLSNTLTLQQAQNLQAEQQRAQENQRAADLAGAALNGMVGDIAQKAGFPDGSPQKIAMHGIVGLIEARLGGSSAAGGIASGISVEALSPLISDYLLTHGYDISTKEGLTAYNEMMGLGATLVGAASGALAGGKDSAGMGGMMGKNADANNRALHPTETALIKQNASRFAKEMYNTDNPTAEQVQGAMAMLANTAQNLVDYNLDYDVPYSDKAEAFLHTLQSEYSATNPDLSIGKGQFLFYATNDQKNSPYINSGYVDKEISGVIIKAPIRKPEMPGENNSKRDPATNLPLDDEGRYAQQILVDGKMHAPKYFPCPRASAGCGGQNLDMSDPGTAAYVKALDKKILDDIGTAATVVTIVNPVGTAGAIANVVETIASVSSSYRDGKTENAVVSAAAQLAAQQYLQRVYGLTKVIATRIVALVDLGGGWQALANRQQHRPNKPGEKE
ncbi:hemagglutinin repeat-containing protein [Glaciimonas immobilis]|uniref:Filamentous hemagglutinin n=1 Tax=Glaciimonas immobilis TaxID=728004 RepID=A0A840RNL0_9BURK|nr:hemagglutinin repeat-containing protein [Glaciimonas immobilis]KAF3999094.1 filamentous hemagglutinin N-terminal domain-containing protein [Glaciimonas immobilis]MBB5198528.1 filamentous hemagglutinin [Glaciimonas immobilis]